MATSFKLLVNPLVGVDFELKSQGVLFPAVGGLEFTDRDEVLEVGEDLDLLGDTDRPGLLNDDSQGPGSSTLLLEIDGVVVAQADVVAELGAVQAEVVGIDTGASDFDLGDVARLAATVNVALSGTPTIDGVATLVGDRVLLTNQSNAVQNGIWLTAAGGWSRPADFPSGQAAGGAIVGVQEGASFIDSRWIVLTAPPDDVIDTDPLEFAQLATAFDEHEVLDTLVHDLAENSFEELTYSSGRVVNSTVWTDATKVTKIRETQIAYGGGLFGRLVSEVIDIQYDAAGVELYRLTTTLTYTLNRVQTISTVRT